MLGTAPDKEEAVHRSPDHAFDTQSQSLSARSTCSTIDIDATLSPYASARYGSESTDQDTQESTDIMDIVDDAMTSPVSQGNELSDEEVVGILDSRDAETEAGSPVERMNVKVRTLLCVLGTYR